MNSNTNSDRRVGKTSAMGFFRECTSHTRIIITRRNIFPMIDLVPSRKCVLIRPHGILVLLGRSNSPRRIRFHVTNVELRERVALKTAKIGRLSATIIGCRLCEIIFVEGSSHFELFADYWYARLFDDWTVNVKNNERLQWISPSTRRRKIGRLAIIKETSRLSPDGKKSSAFRMSGLKRKFIYIRDAIWLFNNSPPVLDNFNIRSDILRYLNVLMNFRCMINYLYQPYLHINIHRKRAANVSCTRTRSIL